MIIPCRHDNREIKIHDYVGFTVTNGSHVSRVFKISKIMAIFNLISLLSCYIILYYKQTLLHDVIVFPIGPNGKVTVCKLTIFHCKQNYARKVAFM